MRRFRQGQLEGRADPDDAAGGASGDRPEIFSTFLLNELGSKTRVPMLLFLKIYSPKKIGENIAF
jgi:hypothetical protein